MILKKVISLIYTLALLSGTVIAYTAISYAATIEVVGGKTLVNGKVIFLLSYLDGKKDEKAEAIAVIGGVLKGKRDVRLSIDEKYIYIDKKKWTIVVYYDVGKRQEENNTETLRGIYEHYRKRLMMQLNADPLAPPLTESELASPGTSQQAPQPRPTILPTKPAQPQMVFDAADLEKRALASPTYETLLFQSPDLRPSLAQVAKGVLYFSNHRSEDECVGRHVYRASIGGTRALRILDAECVLRISIDQNEDLFVHYKTKDDTILTFAKLIDRDQTGKSLVPGYFSEVRFQDTRRMAELGASRLFQRIDRLSYLAFGELPENAGLLELYTDPLKRSPPVAVGRVYGVEGLVDLNVSLKGNYVYALGNVEGHYQLLFIDVKKNFSVTRYGSWSPLPNWRSIGLANWFARKPRYLTPTAEGFLLADRSDLASEPRSVMYFSSKDRRFHRVLIDDEDVSGLSLAKQGLVVSRQLARSVYWFGRNPLAWKDQVSANLTKTNELVPFDGPSNIQ